MQSEAEFDDLDAGVKPHQVSDELLRGIPIKTMGDSSEIYTYQNGRYIKGGETRLANVSEETLRRFGLDSILSNAFINEVLGSVKRRTYTERKNFDSEPHTLNLANGLLDIKSLNFQEHNPDYLSIVQLPVHYDPEAQCPKILEFLSQVLYEEDIPSVQEMFGFILWREYPVAKSFLLIGEGANGKSTLISLIKALIGPESYSSVSLQSLETNRFASDDLYGKLCNVYADLTDSALKGSGIFKMLTGGDAIRGEYKNRNSFVFHNYAKLIFSCNMVPESHDNSLAFYRRWCMITFPNVFEGASQNRNLLAELTSPEELSGLLNWSLEGLHRLIKNHWEFSNSKSTEDVRIHYIRSSSPTQAFLSDETETDSAGFVPKPMLYSKFTQYCRAAKLPTISSDLFFKRVPQYMSVNSERKEIDGKRVHCFGGLRLKNSSGTNIVKRLDSLDTLANASNLSNESNLSSTLGRGKGQSE